jgi:hypothetical protein
MQWLREKTSEIIRMYSQPVPFTLIINTFNWYYLLLSLLLLKAITVYSLMQNNI